jgi:hypothetical protein
MIRKVFLFFYCSFFVLLRAQEVSIVPNQCIVQLHENSIDEFIQSGDGIELKEVLSKRMKIFLIAKKAGSFAPEELNRLGDSKTVKAIQYNHIVERRSLVPDDPYFAQQWNMLNTGQLNGKPGTDIKATEAWAINTSPLTKNGDTIVVAVVDEYFDLLHEDLNFFANYNEIPGNGIDDDGNGFIDDFQGWNAYNNTGNVYGSGGVNHSTLISGIVGAKGNNTKGVVGVVWGVKVLPVGASSTNEAVVIKGYDYVIEMRKLYNETAGVKGAFIVAANSSFGVNNGQPQNYPIWCALYDTMGSLGILNATATTNANFDVDAVGDIPTTCPSKWMIAVSGTIANDNRYGGYGLKSIDVAAPAGSIISAAVANNYTSSSGTSFACPHVAGAIAAMYAEACPEFINNYESYPDSLALMMKKWLLNSVIKTEPLNNKVSSDGRLNLHAAVLSTHNYNCNNCGTELQASYTDVLCKNDSNGVASLTLANSVSFLWNDSSVNALRNNLADGLYTVTVTDSANCEQQVVIIIREPDTLRINSVNVVAPNGNNPGNIIVNAYCGGDSLWYSLDGVAWQLNNIFSISSFGSFTVYVKNETSCELSQPVVVSSIDDIDFNDLSFKIYPNPVADVLNIEVQSIIHQNVKFEVVDVAGRTVVGSVIEAQQGFQKVEVDVSLLSAGMYFLQIEGGKQQRFFKQQ